MLISVKVLVVKTNQFSVRVGQSRINKKMIDVKLVEASIGQSLPDMVKANA